MVFGNAEINNNTKGDALVAITLIIINMKQLFKPLLILFLFVGLTSCITEEVLETDQIELQTDLTSSIDIGTEQTSSFDIVKPHASLIDIGTRQPSFIDIGTKQTPNYKPNPNINNRASDGCSGGQGSSYWQVWWDPDQGSWMYGSGSPWYAYGISESYHNQLCHNQLRGTNINNSSRTKK